MAAWAIIIMVILAIAIGIFIFLTIYTELDNKKKQQANILYPFSGALTPPSPPWTVNDANISKGAGETPEDGLSLLGAVGGTRDTVPQIQCPVGYKINIVGAFLDIVDPYGECSNTPDSILQATCGDGSDLSNAAKCSTSGDCGVGMECTNGKCIPKKCKSNGDCAATVAGSTILSCSDNIGKICALDHECGDGAKCVAGVCEADPGQGACMACVDGYCASMPTCNFVDKGLNVVCSPSKGDIKKCRPRDASAYLAVHCDGKRTCLGEGDVWIPNTKSGVFGPLPCDISAETGDKFYATLPVTTGWGGGAPINTRSQADVSATFNQGYYVHGIYTCVPENENAVTGE